MTTISELMGCASRRLANDRYLTPPWCVQALARKEAEYWHPTMWEVCAAEGDISKEMRKYVDHVIESDLIANAHCRQLDFLKTTERLATGIVTNPPYRFATRFVEHAVELGVTYHAWLLKADFLCARRGYRLVTELGYPARIWGLTERPDFLGQGAPTMCCSWIVWDGVNKTRARYELLNQ